MTDRAVETGDTVNIDYTGYIDGEVFDGGSATGAPLTIGSKRFIEGFEDGLIGAEIGESVTLNLNFPDPYDPNPDLSGVPVVFEVKVNSIGKQIVPELTEDFVKSLNIEGVGTEKELKSIGTPTSYIFTDVKADSLIVVTFHSPVANESIEASKYQIYTENGAVVVDPDHAAGTVNICDFSGRTIYSNREVRSITRFPLSEGSYIVTLIIDGKQYSQKVYLLSR